MSFNRCCCEGPAANCRHLEGARRILASIELGLSTVPAIIVEGELDDAGIIQRQLITNCIREELSPLDQANAIHNLMIAIRTKPGRKWRS